jgi:hypothetical protein
VLGVNQTVNVEDIDNIQTDTGMSVVRQNFIFSPISEKPIDAAIRNLPKTRQRQLFPTDFRPLAPTSST